MEQLIKKFGVGHTALPKRSKDLSMSIVVSVYLVFGSTESAQLLSDPKLMKVKTIFQVLTHHPLSAMDNFKTNKLTKSTGSVCC